MTGCHSDPRPEQPPGGEPQIVIPRTSTAYSRSDKLNSHLVLGNANAHHAHNLPIFLAGGEFKHGHYVARARNKNTPLSNLFVTMLNNAGLETESFGQSRGSLTW